MVVVVVVIVVVIVVVGIPRDVLSLFLPLILLSLVSILLATLVFLLYFLCIDLCTQSIFPSLMHFLAGFFRLDRPVSARANRLPRDRSGKGIFCVLEFYVLRVLRRNVVTTSSHHVPFEKSG